MTDEIGNPKLPKKFETVKKRRDANALGGGGSSVARARGNCRWHRNVFALSRAIDPGCAGKKHRGASI